MIVVMSMGRSEAQRDAILQRVSQRLGRLALLLRLQRKVAHAAEADAHERQEDEDVDQIGRAHV